MMVTPVSEQPSRFWCHAPLALWCRSPVVDLTPNVINELSELVLFVFLPWTAFRFAKPQLSLLPRSFSPFRFGNWRNEGYATTLLQNSIRRLPATVELPVKCRAIVRGVEDWFVEKVVSVVHD